MWRPVSIGILTMSAACGPVVATPDGGGSGTDSAGDDEDTTGGVTGGAGPGSSGAMSTEAMSTSPIIDDVPFPGDGSGSGSTGADGDLCATIEPLFAVPEETRLFVVDQEGDGIEELWLSFYDGNDPRSVSELFRVSPDGFPNPAGVFPGFLSGLHDIDGDGVRDGVGLTFAGGPPDISFVPGAPELIEGMPLPTSLGVVDGFEAFGDATGDGTADFIRYQDGLLQLLLGDGNGNFEFVEDSETDLQTGVSWMPIEGSALSVVAESVYFEPLETCEQRRFSLVQTGAGPFVNLATSVPGLEFAFSAPILALDLDNGPMVFGRACDGVSGHVTIQYHRFPPEGEPEVDEFEPSTLATMGDLDGDGSADVVLGRITNDGVVVHFGSGTGSFSSGQGYDVEFGETVPARVYTVDLDLDGRDEIILGTREGGSEIVYDRIDLDPC